MKGGTSGGDCIYESFIKYWPDCKFRVWTMLDIDYRPFIICYLHRIILACIISIFEPRRFEVVYSASDFLPDSIPAFLYKITHPGTKWVAGFYLKAFRGNTLHFFSQKLVKLLINKFADMVIVTNPTMYDVFPNKKKTWINGGVDMDLAGLSDEPKIYDAVFVGRIHPSKGIDELIEIWKLVIEKQPSSMLAVIGDGDLGVEYMKDRLPEDEYNVRYYGHLGNERYQVYKDSKVVLYPTPEKYDHFSMAPVEAMACGCKIICYWNNANRIMLGLNGIKCVNKEMFADAILEGCDGAEQVISRKFAEKFDYKKQSLRVYQDIKGVLDEDSHCGCGGNGGKCGTACFA